MLVQPYKPKIVSPRLRMFKKGADAQVFDALRQAAENPTEAKRHVVERFNMTNRKLGDILVGDYEDVPELATLSTSGNFPDRDGVIVDTYYSGVAEPVDTTWTQLFDVRDFRNTTEEDFEIADVTDGLTFRLYENGERVELYTVSGTIAKFPFDLAGSGFQWEKTWLDDNKFWRLTDGMNAASVKYGNFQAELAYLVVTAAGITDESRSTTAGAPVVQLDVETVNAAATNILADMYTEDGYLDQNPRFFLLYNNLTANYGSRVQAMLAAQYGVANATQGSIQLQYPTTPLGSPHVPTGKFFLVYPNRKLKAGIRMDLMMYEKFDITSYTGMNAFWGRFKMARGSAKQVRGIPLS